MTWDQLRLLLESMKKANHVSMDQPVQVAIEDVVYNLDIFESLTTGEVMLGKNVTKETEEEEDAE